MGSDGQVTYEIRGDDSNLDSDLDRARQRVETSNRRTEENQGDTARRSADNRRNIDEDLTDHHEEQNNRRDQSDEESGHNQENNANKTGEKLKSIAGGTAKAIGTGMLAVGTAAIAIGGMAVKSATDMDQAMNQFISSTGKGTDETEKYQTVLEGIYKNNYGESFEDISLAMADVVKQLGDMSDEQLQTVTESAFALRDVFGYEIPESTRAAKAMMDNFGISGDEAMSLIAAGAQNGLDYSGELIDSINEYSTQFAKVGLDADDMFKIFQQGAESGAWNLDKIGDAVKEFSIRSIDGSKGTAEGFAAIGLNADDMATKFAAGGDTAKQAFQDTIDALAGMEDPIAQNTAGVALFGTMWEDLGPEVVAQLAKIEDGAYDTAGAMDGIKETKYDDIGSMFEGLKRSVELLLIPLGEQLIPILSELIESVLPLIEEALPPILEVIGELIAQLAPIIDAILPVLIELFQQLVPPITEIISAVLPVLIELVNALLPIFQILIDLLMPLIDLFMDLLAPILSLIGEALVPLVEALMPVIETITSLLIPILQVLSSQFAEVFKGILGTVTDVIGNITDIFNSLVDFIKNVFTGNWQGAWENIIKIFKSLVDGLVGIFKMPLNYIIDLINGFLGSLSDIQIPDWVPVVGGKTFSMPKIPRLKTGIDFVPGDYFPAFLDHGEAVLTKEENARYQNLGGIQGIEYALSAGQRSQEQKVILGKGCIVVQTNLDGKAAARTMAPHMDTELGESKNGGERMRL